MKSLRARRVISAVSLIAGALALPMVTAGQADASPQRCEISMHNDGYVVGPKVKAACALASATSTPAGVVNRARCQALMLDLGVKSSDAYDACYSY